MINLTVNGATYPYPETGDESWGDPGTNWAAAISAQVLYRTGGSFVLSAEVDFGGTAGLKALQFKFQDDTALTTAGTAVEWNNIPLSGKTAANVASLPASGAEVGIVYYVQDTNTLYAWSGSSWDLISSGGGGGAPPTGPASGDLSNNYPNPIVTGLDGESLSTTSSADGSVLKYNDTSTQWENVATDIIDMAQRGLVQFSFATGDMDTNDAAISAAITEAITDGKDIKFPKGEFWFSRPWELTNASGLTVYGAGDKDVSASDDIGTEFNWRGSLADFTVDNANMINGDKLVFLMHPPPMESIVEVELIAGTDFTIGATSADTATNIITAINAHGTLPTYVEATADTTKNTRVRIFQASRGTGGDELTYSEYPVYVWPESTTFNAFIIEDSAVIMRNCRKVTFRDLIIVAGFQGYPRQVAVTTYYDVDYPGQTPTANRFEKVKISATGGSNGYAYCIKGTDYQWVVSPGAADGNNDYHVLQDCELSGFTICGANMGMSQAKMIQYYNTSINGFTGSSQRAIVEFNVGSLTWAGGETLTFSGRNMTAPVVLTRGVEWDGATGAAAATSLAAAVNLNGGALGNGFCAVVTGSDPDRTTVVIDSAYRGVQGGLYDLAKVDTNSQMTLTNFAQNPGGNTTRGGIAGIAPYSMGYDFTASLGPGFFKEIPAIYDSGASYIFIGGGVSHVTGYGFYCPTGEFVTIESPDSEGMGGLLSTATPSSNGTAIRINGTRLATDGNTRDEYLTSTGLPDVNIAMRILDSSSLLVTEGNWGSSSRDTYRILLLGNASGTAPLCRGDISGVIVNARDGEVDPVILHQPALIEARTFGVGTRQRVGTDVNNVGSELRDLSRSLIAAKSRYAIDASIIAAGGNNHLSLINNINLLNGTPGRIVMTDDTTWNIGGDVTIPSNVTLVITENTKLNITGGNTFTNNGVVLDRGGPHTITGTLDFGTGSWKTGAAAQGANVATKTANYTVIETDEYILVDATAGAVTITLPAITTLPQSVKTIKKTDSSANAVTVATTGGDTIDGAATLTIANQYDAAKLLPNGTEWSIV